MPVILSLQYQGPIL